MIQFLESKHLAWLYVAGYSLKVLSLPYQVRGLGFESRLMKYLLSTLASTIYRSMYRAELRVILVSICICFINST